uniref:Poly(A) RNA polymerase mitochondrial-like central palm domain-containing protein n=1 Tax=Salix viminalis TaxID=40686 RepID=A0A6N2NL70_SALVM
MVTIHLVLLLTLIWIWVLSDLHVLISQTLHCATGIISQGTTMNTYRVLEPTLKDILNGVQPLREDWVMRFKIIEELEDVVRSVESLRGATVEPFGSFVSNLFTRWGDLDISIVLSNGSFISSAGKKRKQNLLGDVQRALRQRSELLHLYSYLLHVDIHEKSMRSINHVYFTTCNK